MALPKLNFTAVPNIIFDEYQKHLSGGEFKTLCTICRKTIGWHKEADSISISQLQDLTGMSRPSIVAHIKKLEEAKLIVVDKKRGKGNTYTLAFEESKNFTSEATNWLNNLTSTSKKTLPTKERLNKRSSTRSTTYGSSNRDSRIPFLIAKYKELHNEYRGFDPNINYGGAGAVFKRLLQNNTPELIEQVMFYFFSYNGRTNTTVYDLEKNFDHVYGYIHDKANGRRK